LWHRQFQDNDFSQLAVIGEGAHGDIGRFGVAVNAGDFTDGNARRKNAAQSRSDQPFPFAGKDAAGKVQKFQLLTACALDNPEDIRMPFQRHADGAAAVGEEQDDAMVAMDFPNASDEPLMVQDGSVARHAVRSASVDDGGAKPVAPADGNDFGGDKRLTDRLPQLQERPKPSVLFGEMAQVQIFGFQSR
jgi:hypothetical protein